MKIYLKSRVEEPWHLKDVDIVEDVRVALLHQEDDVVDQVQGHVLQPSILAVKHPGDLLVDLLPLQPFKVVHQHLLNVIHTVSTFDVFTESKDYQLAPILKQNTFKLLKTL